MGNGISGSVVMSFGKEFELVLGSTRFSLDFNGWRKKSNRAACALMCRFSVKQLWNYRTLKSPRSDEGLTLETSAF